MFLQLKGLVILKRRPVKDVVVTVITVDGFDSVL